MHLNANHRMEIRKVLMENMLLHLIASIVLMFIGVNVIKILMVNENANGALTIFFIGAVSIYASICILRHISKVVKLMHLEGVVASKCRVHQFFHVERLSAHNALTFMPKSHYADVSFPNANGMHSIRITAKQHKRYKHNANADYILVHLDAKLKILIPAH